MRSDQLAELSLPEMDMKIRGGYNADRGHGGGMSRERTRAASRVWV